MILEKSLKTQTKRKKKKYKMIINGIILLIMVLSEIILFINQVKTLKN